MQVTELGYAQSGFLYRVVDLRTAVGFVSV